MTDEKGVRETQAPLASGAAPRMVKVRRIGNSLGIVIPADELARQRVAEGDVLHLVQTPTGFRLEVYDPEVAEQVEAGRAIARRYRNTLRELAK